MGSKLIVGIFGAILLIGGIFILMGNKKNAPLPSGTSEETPAVSVQPTVSETETVAQVMIDQNGFSPKTLKVKAGTTVVWANQSGMAVAIYSAVHPTHLVYPPLNLGEVASGLSVELVFDKPGTYKYHDHLNPSQTGEVVVE